MIQIIRPNTSRSEIIVTNLRNTCMLHRVNVYIKINGIYLKYKNDRIKERRRKLRETAGRPRPKYNVQRTVYCGYHRSHIFFILKFVLRTQT